MLSYGFDAPAAENVFAFGIEAVTAAGDRPRIVDEASTGVGVKEGANNGAGVGGGVANSLADGLGGLGGHVVESRVD